MNLYTHNLSQKTAIMVETFRENTRHKIGGKAKAMVVTASRLHAIRYYQQFNEYIEKKGYDDIHVLIAFSGSLKDGEIEYTEESLNRTLDGKSIREKQLPEEFHKDGYSILIVAEKYQTGFDEPLLHTMFVDKRLQGVKAVQTLSRLNRTCSGKTDTFVLDFVNTAEEIEESFKPYYTCTTLDEGIDPNIIYDIRESIKNYGFYDREDIKKFLKIFLKKGKQTERDLGKLTGIFKPVIDKYLALDEEQRYEYKGHVKNFNKWYSYIIQITRMYDKELQEEFNFTHYLEKLLPQVKDDTQVDLNNKLRLEFYKLEKSFEGSIALEPTKTDEMLINTKEAKSSTVSDEPLEALDELIKKINERFKGIFNEEDKVIVETIFERCKKDKNLKKYAQKNDEEVFNQSIFPDVFGKIAQQCYMESMKSFTKLFQDKDFYESIMKEIARETYRDFNS